MSKIKSIYLLLIIIVLLGSFLRVHDLNTENLWTDEIITLDHLKADSLETSIADRELTPTFYFNFLKYWTNLFGTSEQALRSLSIVFDLLAIIFIFLLGAKLFNKKVGLLAALFLATTMLQVLYAQEARPYSMFGFLVLLATYFLVLSVSNKKSNYWFAYAISLIVALYTSYMTFFVVMFHFLAILFWKRKWLWKFLMASLISILAFIPGLTILHTQILLRQPALQQAFIARGIPPFLANLGIGFYLLPITFLACGLVLAYCFLRKVNFKKVPWKFLTLLVTLIILVVHLVLLDKTLRSFSLIRHSFFVVPFFYLLLAYAILSLKSKKVQALIIFMILMFNAFTLYVYYEQTTKAPWEETIDFIEENSPNTLLLFTKAESNINLFEYYYPNSYRKLELTWEMNHARKYFDKELLLSELESEDRFWLISSRDGNYGKEYKKFLDKHFTVVKEKHGRELSVYLYEVG